MRKIPHMYIAKKIKLVRVHQHLLWGERERIQIRLQQPHCMEIDVKESKKNFNRFQGES